MKTGISAALESHLNGEVTTLATCWKATRKDGRIFGFTDHTSSLTINGVVYKASTGFTPTAITTSGRLDVDNLDVTGLLDDLSITEADLHNGRWDYAVVEIFQANYNDLTMGVMGLRKGWLGEVHLNRHHFVGEIRGLMQALQQTIGELYSPGCRANFGDARCKVNTAPYTFNAAVTAVTSNREFTAAGLGQAADYFNYGLVTWTGGDNAELEMEVKTFASGVVILQLPMPYTVSVGDVFRIVAGCQKRFAEDCVARFANGVNFRGEPYVPGPDQVMRGPSR